MNILAWNYRGLANSRTVQELCSLTRKYKPKIVFLSETWQNETSMVNMRWRIGLKNCLAVESKNRGGGIVVYWDELVDVTLQTLSERHIDVLIKEIRANVHGG